MVNHRIDGWTAGGSATTHALTQLAAVRTCWSETRTPPQKIPAYVLSRAAIQGQRPGAAGRPPTMRRERRWAAPDDADVEPSPQLALCTRTKAAAAIQAAARIVLRRSRSRLHWPALESFASVYRPPEGRATQLPNPHTSPVPKTTFAAQVEATDSIVICLRGKKPST